VALDAAMTDTYCIEACYDSDWMRVGVTSFTTREATKAATHVVCDEVMQQCYHG